MDKTIEYYNRNVEAFVSETVDVDFSQVQDLFLQMLPEKSRILDFGCGSEGIQNIFQIVGILWSRWTVLWKYVNQQQGGPGFR